MMTTGRMKIVTPRGLSKVLLHVCCAPCSGNIIVYLKESGIDLGVFFYNPNIHPIEEYERRKEDLIRYARKMDVPVIDGDYHHEAWLEEVSGLEKEPERGQRCEKCIAMRLSKTAVSAHEYRFPLIATTLSLSRWKDMDQVNRCGEIAVKPFSTVTFWPYNWRKQDGEKKASVVSRVENFYRQKYCGCEFQG
ncbi:MAG: epoxyqueuosine reductase QueH [Candidatus Omnitrophica bacterium]|nr:epoxyqueuosine reductase QueH [Candidatus Omnitrophota bacterium]